MQKMKMRKMPGVSMSGRLFCAVYLLFWLMPSSGFAQSVSQTDAQKKAADDASTSGDIRDCQLSSVANLSATAGNVDRDKLAQSINNCGKVANSENHSTYWRSDAFKKIGESYYHLDDLSNAMSNLNKAIELDRTNATAYYARADVYQKMGDARKAVSDFESAASYGDKMGKMNGYQRIALIYNDQYNYDLSIAYLTKAIEIASPLTTDPTLGFMYKVMMANLYKNRGTIWSNKGDSVKAQEDYKKSLDLK
ncbi:tetratricopeptide repeat protein [Rhodopseudomonas sp.]|uniref:tetratricopeptide repeat protein n=1 Tax=Rhodopseudomonas sp. TaxID=1078 RepID=UPI0039E6D276